MDQAAEGNFDTENTETAPGKSSERFTEVMDHAAEGNFDTENTETAPRPSSERFTEVMDQAAEGNFDTENTETAPGPSSERFTEVMDQAAEGNFDTENTETASGPSSERFTEVMDSNENVADAVPDIQSKYTKNKTENAKSKIQNGKTKKMTVASVPERKSLKRKAAHPPTSEMVMDSIKSLKKRNGASFEDIRKYMEEKYVVNMKLLKRHVDKFLQKSVGNGVLEKIDRGGAEGRFKIKKSENIKKDSKNLARKEGKIKSGKKMAATQKQIKK